MLLRFRKPHPPKTKKGAPPSGTDTKDTETRKTKPQPALGTQEKGVQPGEPDEGGAGKEASSEEKPERAEGEEERKEEEKEEEEEEEVRDKDSSQEHKVCCS